jgi:LysM repeat protein
MAGRNPVRFLAPIVLLAFAFALYHVVQNAREPKDTPASEQSTGSATATPTSAKTTAKKSSGKRKTYTVKRGDTPSGIAQKAGLTLAKLNALNPKLRSRSLTPGQKLRLAK